jgi:hypothetical protein
MKKCFNANAECRFLTDYPKHVALLSHTTGATLEARWMTLVEAHTSQRDVEGDSD